MALLIGVGATFLFLRPPGETGSSTDGTSGKTDSDPSSAKTGSGSGKTDGGGSSDPAPRPNPDAKPGAVFLEDTFTKRTRLGSAWKLLDPDPERWQLKEDGLLIIARIPTNEVDPKTKRSRTIIWNILELQPALPQDYEITVEWLAAFEVKTRYGGNPRGEAVGQTLQLELHTLHRQVGCRVTHKSYDNSRRYQLARWMFKTIKAKTEWIPNSYEWVPRKVEPRPVLLRITKQGTRFKTYLMVDQAWFEIGAMDVLHMKDPRVRISQFVEPDSPTLSPETQAIIKRVSIVAR